VSCSQWLNQFFPAKVLLEFLVWMVGFQFQDYLRNIFCPGPSWIDFTFGRVGGGLSVSGFISFWLRPCCSKPDLFSWFRVRPIFISGFNLFPICRNSVLKLENLLESQQGTRVLDAA